MKNKFFACALLCTVFGHVVKAQTVPPPVEWESVEWERYDMDGQPLLRFEGGEDWWYSHINVYDQGKLKGILTVGYAGWAVTDQNLSLANSFASPGCENVDYSVRIADPDIHELETINNVKGPNRGSVAFFTPDGEFVWRKLMNSFDLQEAVPTADGGFILVGTHESDVSTINGQKLVYNPTSSTNNTFTSCDANNDGTIDQLDNFERKMYISKINSNGDMIWEYVYADEDISNYEGSFLQHSVGYGIAPTNDGHFIASGVVKENGLSKLFVVKIDGSGNVVLKKVLDSEYTQFPSSQSGVTEVNREGWGIVTDGNGNNLILGGEYDLDNNNPDIQFSNYNRGFVLCLDNNLNKNTNWATNPVFFNSTNPVNKNTKVWSGGYHSGNNEFLVPAIIDCEWCLFAGKNQGELSLYRLNANTGQISGSNNPQYLFTATAYDLRANATETADGGIAVVSASKKPGYENVLNASGKLEPNPIYATDPDIPQVYKDDHSWVFRFWDTDTHVAKLDGTGSILWDKRFGAEAHENSRDGFPWNLKRQECMYGITETPEGGLVVSGNTGDNFDDMYLAKIKSDCQVKALYNAGTGDITQDLLISAGTTITWNTPKRVFDKVTVEPGATLIIDGTTIEFADYQYLNEAKDLFYNGTQAPLLVPTIVVEPGGRLLVKNQAVLKGLNECGREWEWLGVQVVGNPSMSQSMLNQGYMSIDNSTVENAKMGILANRSNFYIGGIHTTDKLLEGGGIINAQQTTFKNCRRAIHFTAYPYSEGINNSNSKIEYCEFVNDAPLVYSDLKGKNIATSSFVSIYRTHGVNILGNSFTFDESNFDLFWQYRPTGISTWDATYNVRDYCNGTLTAGQGATTCQGTWVHNTFNNLYKGVEANAIAGVSRAKVNGAEFNDNLIGVSLEGASYCEVVQSTFNVSERGITVGNATSIGHHFGVYATSAAAYKVEDNVFNGIQPGESKFSRSIGVYNENSSALTGSGGNIYLNDFNNIGIGTQMAQNNETITLDCNNYVDEGANSEYDWAVSSGKVGPQGDQVLLPAANEFRANATCTPESQIFHHPLEMLTYNAKNGSEPICVSSTVWAITNILGDNECPSTLVGGTPLDWAEKMNLLETEKNNLNNLIDGGDTENLLYVVATKDEGTIRNLLLQASPYLSDEVLIAVIQKRLSDETTEEIVVENSALTKEVMEEVNRSGISKAVKSRIELAQEGVSERYLLEESIQSVESRRLFALNEAVRLYIDEANLTAAVELLEEEETIAARRALLPIEANRNEAKANAHIAIIREKADEIELVTPESKTIEELRNYCNYFESYMQIKAEKGSLFNMDEDDLELIQAFALKDDPIAITAESVLKLVQGNAYPRLGEDLPNGKSAGSVQNQPEGVSLAGTEFQVFPNPASGEVNFQFAEQSIGSQLSIHNILGEKQFSTVINSTLHRVDCTTYPKGVYLVVVSQPNGETTLKKLVIE